ncbi:hypothetical protein TVAG_286760 [Trichomonas vaginalis G3]|uniref:Uncharacterized protein n=1 Tax=Trichomonas vaginalis (strain ATCC PRA-98 / G3) TaxID=412133 RepID=A2F3F9_TRIV3|nr:hypothetical protein TVAGG3_0245270 [Trichomonas vaginalis G3]EAY00539.1 hypothetical protein TVAG_286760 [Trichomonas vaginalis G3]KAI5553611.1 hypothetical protein TVAGG3_0245270 [Trichomonas vaginalis G3]|eukprot:XP_001313468.1 hypothetical protein [Trichomonas vaginalis G3]
MSFIKTSPISLDLITEVLEYFKISISTDELLKAKTQDIEDLKKFFLNSIEFFLESKWELIKDSDFPQVIREFLFEHCYKSYSRFSPLIMLKYSQIVALYFLLTQDFNAALQFLRTKESRYIVKDVVNCMLKKMAIEPKYKSTKILFLENDEAREFFITTAHDNLEFNPDIGTSSFEYIATIYPNNSWINEEILREICSYLKDWHAYSHIINIFAQLLLKTPDNSTKNQIITNYFTVESLQGLLEDLSKNSDQNTQITVVNAFMKGIYLIYLYTENSDLVGYAIERIQSSLVYARVACHILTASAFIHPDLIKDLSEPVIQYMVGITSNPSVYTLEELISRSKTCTQFFSLLNFLNQEFATQYFTEVFSEINVSDAATTCYQLIIADLILKQHIKFDITNYVINDFSQIMNLGDDFVASNEYPHYNNLVLYTRLLSKFVINDSNQELTISSNIIQIHINILSSLEKDFPSKVNRIVSKFILQKLLQFDAISQILNQNEELINWSVTKLDLDFTRIASTIAIAYKSPEIINNILEAYFDMLNDPENTDKDKICLNMCEFLTNMSDYNFGDQLEAIVQMVNIVRQNIVGYVQTDTTGLMFGEYIKLLKIVLGGPSFDENRIQSFIEETNNFIESGLHWSVETVDGYFQNLNMLNNYFLKSKNINSESAEFVIKLIKFGFAQLVYSFQEIFAPSHSKDYSSRYIRNAVRNLRLSLLYYIKLNKDIPQMPRLEVEFIGEMIVWGNSILENYNLNLKTTKHFTKFVATLTSFNNEEYMNLFVSKVFDFAIHNNFDPNAGRCIYFLNQIVPYIFTNDNSPFKLNPSKFLDALSEEEGPRIAFGEQALIYLIENLKNALNITDPAVQKMEINIRVRIALNIAYKNNIYRM